MGRSRELDPIRIQFSLTVHDQAPADGSAVASAAMIFAMTPYPRKIGRSEQGIEIDESDEYRQNTSRSSDDSFEPDSKETADRDEQPEKQL
jgi:hypothetical protein